MLFPRLTSALPAERVVITGAGIITAFGCGWEINADGFRSGRCAIGPVTLFDVSRQRTQIAAEAILPPALPRTALSKKRESRLDRAAQLLLHSAYEAFQQAGWSAPENAALILGTTSGGMALGETYLRHTRESPASNRRQPTRVVHYNGQQQALTVCDALSLNGPITIIANACASGANAIGHGFDLVRTGGAHCVLAGGYDALCQLTFAGFDSLQALAPAPCRPFDASRNGLSLGEGAGMLALESLPHAQTRGAKILGEIIGYASVTDNHHLTQPDPQGAAACAAMTSACEVARITPSEVDYLNAHGTATPQNDAAEAAAITRWAGARAATLPVSSTKSGIGHLLGAAGAVEAVVCLMALRGQWLPPQREPSPPNAACGFRIVAKPESAEVNIALSNSFGFGGANATLILRRWV